MDNILFLNRNDLREELQNIFCMMQAEADKQAEIKASEQLITPEEAAKILCVSSVTLWRWDKSNYLKPIYIGGKKRYRNSDLQQIINGKG